MIRKAQKSCAHLTCILLLSVGTLLAQAKPARVPYYIDPAQLPLIPLLPPPPDSTATHAELAELHRLEKARTPAIQAAAKIDEEHEDIFLYATVFGPTFAADKLPLTFALSKHLRNDVAIVDAPLKAYFARPRPYNADPTLHPGCETNKENSYPSGHAFNGYIYALALAEMVPEKSAQILARADAYAHSRLECEAHYPSDLEASRRAAYALFGALLTSATFRADLAAAKAEIRQILPPQ